MNSDKLNHLIKIKSNGNIYLSQHYHQMFFFEHILMRIEKSKYKNNIILKGGVLLSSIIGEDLRTTKDIDATLKSIPLNIESISKIIQDIISTDINDNVYFEIQSIKDIRIDDEYNGYRINIKGIFDKIKSFFFFEITTGDVITPKEIKYKYKSIFSDNQINILAYNIETIIAEKFHSIISKNITTTRSKDFYDIYMLINNHYDLINKAKLKPAIKNTFKKRDSLFDIERFKNIIHSINNSSNLRKNYLNYQEKLEYTKNVSFNDTINSLNIIINILDDNY